MPARNPDLTVEEMRAKLAQRQAKWLQTNRDEFNRKRREAYRRKHPIREREPEPEPEPVDMEVIEPEPAQDAYDLKSITDRLKSIDGGSAYTSAIRTLHKANPFEDITEILRPGMKTVLANVPQQNGKPLSVNSRKQLVQGLLWTITKLNIPIPEAVMAEIRAYFAELKLDSADEHEKTPKRAVPNWKDYLLHVRSKFDLVSKEMLVARLYNKIPARDDFKLMVIRREVTDEPVIAVVPVKGAVRIIIRAFKTAGGFPGFDATLEQTLSNYIRKYMAIKNLAPGDYLLGAKVGSFIREMNAKLGFQDAGVSFFRSMHAPELGKEVSNSERVMIAMGMKHSPASQKRYQQPRLPADYWKKRGWGRASKAKKPSTVVRPGRLDML